MYESPQHFLHEKEFDADGVQVSFLDQLKRLEPGSTVYEVYALTAPEDLGGTHVKIADIKLKTRLVTSKFADKTLYFRHVGVNYDYPYWPKSWRKNHTDHKHAWDNVWGREVPENVWPKRNDEAKDFFTEQVTQFGCPFAWLLQ